VKLSEAAKKLDTVH